MKSILYAGAALMIGAAIYGFVDYKKTNTSREFRNMYEEKELPQQVVSTEDEPVISPIELVSEDKKAKEIITAKEKEIRAGEIKRAGDKTTQLKKSGTEKELSPELFSRAPLREIPKVAVREKLKKANAEASKTGQ